MSKTRVDLDSLLKALLVFALLMGFFIPAFLQFRRYERALEETRLAFAASQLGRHLEQAITTRVRVLTLLGHIYPALHVDTKAEFAKWSLQAGSDIQGFMAINWMSPDGVIEWVTPEEENRAALGMRVIDRPEVRDYILRARETRTPQLSQFVTLYQGPVGFAVYVPIYDGDVFRGWINGVFTRDDLLLDGRIRDQYEDFLIRVHFAGQADEAFEKGAPGEADAALPVGRFDVPLLNQKLLIEVRHRPGLKTSQEGQAAFRIAGGVLASSLLVSWFTYLVLRSRRRLRERLEKEQFQGILLNLLVHDIMNPLLIVRYSVEAAFKVADALVRDQLTKTRYGLQQMQEVITRVKDLRAIELGKSRPTLTPVPVNEIIGDTLKLFEARIREKGLVADFRMSEDNPRILVDRAMFQNNVVNNVLSNAVKFSEPGGRLTMEILPEAGDVVIAIKDNGVGMSPELVRSLEGAKVTESTPGTAGELGTGIGLLQVRAYTHFFGGRVKIHSSTKAADPKGHGTTFCLRLPKDSDGRGLDADRG